MPPDGVVVMAQSVTEWPARVLADQMERADRVARARPRTEMMGEDATSVIRVRKTPSFWNVERWPQRALMWEAEDEADVPF